MGKQRPTDGDIKGILEVLAERLANSGDDGSAELAAEVDRMASGLDAEAAEFGWNVEVSTTKPDGGVYVEEIAGVDAGDTTPVAMPTAVLTFSLPDGREEAVTVRPGLGVRVTFGAV